VDPVFRKELETFTESEEGRAWLKSHGWVRSADIIEKAIILPVSSDDILEDALVMLVDRDDVPVKPLKGELPEGAVLGKVAVIE
jgi:hypothetical protein